MVYFRKISIGRIYCYIFTVSGYVRNICRKKDRRIFAGPHGPNRAGPFGILQPLADGGKLFFKEEIIPLASSKFLFILGPSLAMITAMLTSAVIPWGTPLHIFGQ